jgi:hypothetical protein
MKRKLICTALFATIAGGGATLLTSAPASASRVCPFTQCDGGHQGISCHPTFNNTECVVLEPGLCDTIKCFKT